jgi:3-oxoacyl-[acyl-carrier-protein] synthase-1
VSDNQRVFITGLSALTACGLTADETWSSVLEGKIGIDEIKQWDVSSWSHRLGGELKNFQPAKMLPDRKLLKVISRHDVMGINAAMQAVDHSQLITHRDTLKEPHQFNEKTAVYVGSPGNKYLQQYDFLPLMAKTDGDMAQFGPQLFSEVHPMWLLRILPNNVLAYTGITYGFKGPNQNITNHAVGGTQAIIEAYHAIKNGLVDRAVVVAYDVATEPQALFYYEKLGVISQRHLKPFDEAHDGTLLAEGAAAMVLESEASVKARSARCYGEIAGGISGSEAAGLFSIEAEGEQLALLLNRLLENQQLAPEDISMVVAHGNGNIKSDVSEARALHAVFGNHQVPVTAFKWAMGHTICASGLVDAVLTTYALGKKCVPGIANLEQVAPDCQALNISREPRTISGHKVPTAIMINRGFASMNACLVIKGCD